MTKRQLLKLWLLENRCPDCEARRFWPHVCEPGTADMHEVIYPRHGVPLHLQDYLWDKRNCILVCHHLHIPEGQTKSFNAKAIEYLAGIYGWPALVEYAARAPFIVKRALTTPT